MTPERLAEIKERVAKATEGPWEARNMGYPDGTEGVGHFVPTGRPHSTRWSWLLSLHGDPVDTKGQVVYDAEFIAHARTDVPDLVAEVERLRERTEALEQLLVCYRVGKRPSEKLLQTLECTSRRAEAANG